MALLGKFQMVTIDRCEFTGNEAIHAGKEIFDQDLKFQS